MIFKNLLTFNRFFFKKIFPFLIFVLFLENHENAICHDKQNKNIKFLSIKSDKVNMRTGPNNRYDIKFVYIKKYLPFKIVGSFEEWYFAEDPFGEKGWIKKNLFFNSKKQNFAFVSSENGIFCYNSPSKTSKIKIDNFYILKIHSCKNDFCFIKLDKKKFCCEKKDLWGI